MKYISYKDSLLEVRFSRIISPSEKYFVELKKGEAPVAFFDMTQDSSDTWTVVEPAPSWVINLILDPTRAIRN